MEEGMAKSEKGERKKLRKWRTFGTGIGSESSFAIATNEWDKKSVQDGEYNIPASHVSPPPQRLYYFAFPLVPLLFIRLSSPSRALFTSIPPLHCARNHPT
jgi:hypothetical protein